MPHIITVREHSPQFGSDCFVAVTATIIGDVIAGNNCSFWFGCIVRGDVNYIRIGNKVNIQDGAIIHCTYQKAFTIIGNNVSIGHAALVHGCIVKDNALIGMGSIVMDHAEIGENAIIAAGAVVLEKTIVPPNTLWAGVPAKQIKVLDADFIKNLNSRTADNYVHYASWFEK